MKKNLYRHIYSLLLAIALLAVHPQEVCAQIKYGLVAKSKIKLAKKKMEEFDFRAAASIFRDVLSDPKYAGDTLSLRKVAECEINTGQFGMAEGHLKLLTSISTARASDYHKLAEVYKIEKKYPEALDTYKKLIYVDPNDEVARKYANNPDFINPILRDSSIYTVNLSAINSTGSDFSPGFFTNGKIVFSSSRGLGAGAKRLYNWTQQPYLNIYTADFDDSKVLSNAQVLGNDINTRYHEGTVAYDAANNTLYFTRNNFVRGNVTKARSGRLYLGIYSAKINPDGTWGTMEKFAENHKEWSTGHPTITPSGNRIYFVSDKPGGAGGTDIYYCDKENNKWTSPRSAGSQVNTMGDEAFPFALNDSILYFSSNGQLGLGGFDMFSINLNDSLAAPQNMGYPANTHYDDFGVIFFPDEVHGYFSSNRPGGPGDDDIYEFSIHPPDSVSVAGVVVDEKTKLPIANALVTINNDDGSVIQALTDDNGHYVVRVPYKEVISIGAEKKDYEPGNTQIKTKARGLDYKAPDIALKKVDFVATGKVLHDLDGTPAIGAMVRLIDESGVAIDSVMVREDGSYLLILEANKNYKLEASKPEYVLLTKEINTKPGASKNISNNFRLFKLEKGTVVRLDNIYYDYGKWAIRPDAALELNKLVQILKDNPTMKIELSSHTDARGSDSYNLNLSEKRAKSAVEYLISQGIAQERLIAKGYGETKLLNHCGNDVKCTEEEHQFNRRTEFTILDI